MRLVRPLVATLALGAASCSPSTSNGGASQPVSGGGCFPIAPLRLSALEHGREWEPIAEVTADGTIVHLAKGSRPMARIANDQLVDGAGRTTLICTTRGEVAIPGESFRAHFGPHDEWDDGEMTIFVGDDGAVMLSSRGRSMGGAGKVRVEGPVRAARRTAELLVLVALMGPPR